MKNLFVYFLAISLLAGCESSTEHGSCIGIQDEKDAGLQYKISVRNLVLGVVFFEMVFPPIVVGLNEFYCPVGAAKH